MASASTTLANMVDLALGTPDIGAVNFSILNTLLHTMLTRLNIENVQATFEQCLATDMSLGKPGVVSFNRIEERVHMLEQHWNELNVIPTNSELFRRVRKLRMTKDELEALQEEEEEEDEEEENYEKDEGSVVSGVTEVSQIDGIPMSLIKTGQPVHDMWQSIQIVKQTEKNTEGIDKLFSMVQDIMSDISVLKELTETLLVQSNNSAGGIDKFTSQMESTMKSLRRIERRVAELERQMSFLPDEDYFNSLPTWAKLEQYFQGIHDAIEQASDDQVGGATIKKRAERLSVSIISRSSHGASDSEFTTKGKRHRGPSLVNFDSDSETDVSVVKKHPPPIEHRSPTPSEHNHPAPPEPRESHHAPRHEPPQPAPKPHVDPHPVTKSDDDDDFGVDDELVETTETRKEEAKDSIPMLNGEIPIEEGQALCDDIITHVKDMYKSSVSESPVDDRDHVVQVMHVTDMSDKRKPLTAHAPATAGLQTLMEKLGGISERHEELVKRVDALELWLRAELDKKANSDMSELQQLGTLLDEFSSMRDEMACIRALFNKESGSLVCAQEKMKQLQADIDCILKACYNDGEGSTGTRCGPDSRKPDCSSLEIRLSWCVMEERVKLVQADVNAIFERMGGRRTEEDGDPEQFTTMTEVQIVLKSVFEELDTKAPLSLVQMISVGFGDVFNDLLVKMLDTDNEWRRIVGFIASVIDGKLDLSDMNEFSESINETMRCVSRRLDAVVKKVDGDSMDPAAGTKKARCISCDRVVRTQRQEGEINPFQNLPPGLPVTRSIKMFTSFEMEEIRQLARRPNAAHDPYAVYRKVGGVTDKKMAAKRVAPTSACVERQLVDCEKECVDGTAGVTNLSCFAPMDIQSSLETRRPCPCSKSKPGRTNAGNPPEPLPRPTAADCKKGKRAAGAASPTVDPADEHLGEELREERQQAEPDKLDQIDSKPVSKRDGVATTLTAHSPCMAKSDLKEFVLAQRNAVVEVVARNPDNNANKFVRQEYKFPTRNYGSQVGGSLTKISAGEEGGTRVCGSAFRVQTKRKQ